MGRDGPGRDGPDQHRAGLLKPEAVASADLTHTRLIWVRSALATASGFNRLGLVTYRCPSNFAMYLPRKEGTSVPKLDSSKYWDKAIGMLLPSISGFIISNCTETALEIDAWKTGGLLYFPALIILTCTRSETSVNPFSDILSTTVVKDVYDAGMQIQASGRDDDGQERTSQQRSIGTNDPSDNLNLAQGEDVEPDK